MRGRVARVLACLLLFLAAPARADDLVHLTARPQVPPPGAEGTVGPVRLGDGIVLIPESYRPGRPLPLLVMLHGASQRGADMVARLAPTAEARGVIIAAPDSGDYTWDMLAARKHEADERWGPRYGTDPARIDAFLALVFSRYAVDPSRVALAGFSDGATYALSLGPENRDLFPTLIAFSPGHVAPLHTQGATSGGGQIRVFISHGKADRVLPLEETARATVPAFTRRGFLVELRVFDGGHTMPPEVVEGALDWWLGPR
ncbi:phospholipase/carboxylesterase [Nitrospirillum amazonense]|uniref:Phospholipase/carboxylesterase n=1 Tax=Nitrospirillum amazonense TaxID=28077 RepID=A0A560F6K0_9PROT|nr:alpha/beta hydrolase-fold protein [Nitrospirillum amazonense]TWB17256.1 phospholipase/carboxylesterase [Nitrospirillum amazonense]